MFFLAVIEEEATDSRAEVKSFDHTKLKHVETEERNPLPTPQTLAEERRPDKLADVSEVKSFEKDKLKHVETVEKDTKPSKDCTSGIRSQPQRRSDEYITIQYII